jgi:hypothetical protein
MPMSSDDPKVGSRSLGVKRYLASAAFGAGIGVYLTSFFLPAVDPYKLGNIPGWACAWTAFFAPWDKHESPLAFFGGLINPIIIAYVVLRISGRAPRVRIALESAILLCIPLTWLSLLRMHFGIAVGHIAWITGILLIISWKDFSLRTRLVS